MNINNFKLGILGGGQLGKMLCQAASAWNLNTSILDPAADCPASLLATNFYMGDFANYKDVYRFGNSVDLLTIEIEHVNSEALTSLKEIGLKINPDPEILKLIQDKSKQKQFYLDKDIPTSKFRILKDKNAIMQALQSGEITVPFVQKSCKHGYDGKGVVVADDEKMLQNLLDCESVIEELVDIEKEISVIVARNELGEIRCYDPVEMVFNSKANLVEMLVYPCEIESSTREKAFKLAKETITELGLFGILAVEMFLDKKGNLLVNEVAPRPHNSGHQTIESAVTSQYEQCLRAVLNLPLGSTDIKVPSVMVNLLGQPGHDGKAYYDGLDNCMKIEGASLHLYGKTETKPFRKMGHVTVVDNDISSAKEKALYIKHNLKVISE